MPLFEEAVPGDPPIPYGGRAFRTLIDATFSSAGVLSSAAWAVSQHAAGASFQVDISAGMGVVTGNATTNLGKWLERTDGVAQVTMDPPPASGARTDLIVAQIMDPQSDQTQTAYGFTFLPVKGADSVGTVPPVPANALLLAQINRAAGSSSVQTADITDRRVLAVGDVQPAYWGGARTTYAPIANTTGGPFIVFGLWQSNGKSIGIDYDETATTGIFTVRSAGRYRVQGQIAYGPESNPAGQRVVRLYFNSTNVWETTAPGVAGINVPLPFSGTRNLSAGGTIHVETYQSQGSGTNLAVGPGLCVIDIQRV